MSLHLDLETVATVDLRRTGVYRYAEDVYTDVILACYKLPGSSGVHTWRPGMQVPPMIAEAVSGGETIHAWNAQFELALWEGVLSRKHGWPKPKLEQFDCTMARAMYWGYPASLDLAGQVMGTGVLKDKAGHALMLRMCRPRSFAANGVPVWWHDQDATKYNELNAYCEQDVLAEEACLAKLPPLPSQERQLWLLDQKMNAKGMPVDMDLIDAMTRLAQDATAGLAQAMVTVTGGAVSGPTNTAALLAWVNANGVVRQMFPQGIPDLRKETVKEVLRALPDGPARSALILRRDGARASVAKLQAFAEAVCKDGTVKGMLRYYGAGRTGRWSGAGGAKVQPHNLVRGTITGTDHALDLIASGRATVEALEMLFEDSALGVLSSCLRGCFACQ